jgi:hypothetical protein
MDAARRRLQTRQQRSSATHRRSWARRQARAVRDTRRGARPPGHTCGDGALGPLLSDNVALRHGIPVHLHIRLARPHAGPTTGAAPVSASPLAHTNWRPYLRTFLARISGVSVGMTW